MPQNNKFHGDEHIIENDQQKHCSDLVWWWFVLKLFHFFQRKDEEKKNKESNKIEHVN